MFHHYKSRNYILFSLVSCSFWNLIYTVKSNGSLQNYSENKIIFTIQINQKNDGFFLIFFFVSSFSSKITKSNDILIFTQKIYKASPNIKRKKKLYLATNSHLKWFYKLKIYTETKCANLNNFYVLVFVFPFHFFFQLFMRRNDMVSDNKNLRYNWSAHILHAYYSRVYITNPQNSYVTSYYTYTNESIHHRVRAASLWHFECICSGLCIQKIFPYSNKNVVILSAVCTYCRESNLFEVIQSLILLSLWSYLIYGRIVVVYCFFFFLFLF